MNYDYSNTVDFLLDWYELNARILPWRANKNPYYIWISEIMCQQTRVEAVKFFFERFITELPTVKDLAEVDDEKLMKLWEGLGYYSRARNLKAAAIKVMEEHGGELPADYNKLLDLPGIGSYTAGAISSIAFELRQAAVDGNVLRVMKRVANSFDDISKAKVKKELEEDIREIIPNGRAGDFNQAIMELGATVCIPNGKPLCHACPLMHLCEAFKNNTESMIPVKPAKKARKLEDRTILLIKKDDRYFIQKRPDSGLLSGLWELPSMEGKLQSLAMEEKLDNMGIKEYRLTPLGESKHIFSHIEWHMIGYLVEIMEEDESVYVLKEELNYNNTLSIYASKEEIEELYMLPTAFKHYKRW